MFRWRNVVQTFASRYQSAVIKQSEVLVRNMASIADKFKLPARYGTGEESVWVTMNVFVQEHKPKVNLGQGFYDDFPPDYVPQALASVASDCNPLLHQYTRSYGHVRLVNALAELYSPLIKRKLNPLTEIIVGSGAYESLYCAILGNVEQGDEVIVIEPFFDCYEPMIKNAGGTARFIPLMPPQNKCDDITAADWKLDENELAKMFNAKTKMIIINTPHNPTGKVFSRQEMTFIAELCKKHNVLCLSDEVYEFMVYKPNEHIRMATIDGMWERTITVCSAGKVFSVTGWKTGWAYGPANFIRNMQVVHQNCVYTHCTPIQEAIARMVEHELKRLGCPDCYFESIKGELQEKRDYFIKVLKENGFKPTVPHGGYFIMADWSNLKDKLDLSSEKDAELDYKFVKKFAKESGVLCIPPSAFYSECNRKLLPTYSRFCFMKKDENLKLAEKLLQDWNKAKKA